MRLDWNVKRYFIREGRSWEGVYERTVFSIPIDV
jgi:hypothetical protein